MTQLNKARLEIMEVAMQQDAYYRSEYSKLWRVIGFRIY
jgi:hypothetical protein